MKTALGVRTLQWLAALFCTVWALSVDAAGAEKETQNKDLTSLDLATLMQMDVEVTSVSKKETRLGDAAAAIAVVTADDVRRLGISSLPEALRLVTGMQVGRVDAHAWAVSARGFMANLADKLLVLIDGRTIYEPDFAGVHWATQDLMLEDLDRIEVIRGPGATLWGANAVNGVVNIITKRASATQGTLASVSVGTEYQPSVSLRHGGSLSADTHYRAYIKYFDHQGLITTSGEDAPDDINMVRTGFRVDSTLSSASQLMLEGDIYYGEVLESRTLPVLAAPFSRTFDVVTHDHGGHILGRWTHARSASSEFTLQSFFSNTQYGVGGDDTTTNMFDIELQHVLDLSERHNLIWGAGFRWIQDERPLPAFAPLDPPRATAYLYTVFLQDEITLVPQRWRVTLGSKFEHNDQTGFEIQPSVRSLWTLRDRQTIWAAVSRAVRTPSRFENDGRANIAAFPTGPGGPLALLALLGSSDVDSEEMTAYELGYRIEPASTLTVDMAAFYNEYDNLIDFALPSSTFELSPPPPHLLIGQHATNVPGGNSYGAEVSLQWNVTDRWRIAAGYDWMRLRFLEGDRNVDQPKQQLRLRSYLTLREGLELNGAAYYMDRLRNLDIPAYVRLDLGVVGYPRKSLQLGLWGVNLLEHRHLEFRNRTSAVSIEVPRTVMGRIVWSFR